MIHKRKGNGDLSQRRHSTGENFLLIGLITYVIGFNIILFAREKEFSSSTW